MQSDRRGGYLVSARPVRIQQGFTLLEAIVALVLIGSVGMALFGWINTNIMTLSRVQAINAESDAKLNALEYMNSVNPMLAPEGQADLGAYRLRWQAEAITEVRDGANYPFGISLYQLALYRTQVTVKKSGGEPWFDLTLRQVGYKKMRELRLPF